MVFGVECSVAFPAATMRIMALDVGDRRIGVALSDPSLTLASPLCVMQRDTKERDIARIASLVREHGVAIIVLGLPRRMDGTIGEQAKKVASFGSTLARRIPVPTKYWDERLTTAAAEKMMIEAGLSREKRRARIDAAAAVLILQAYLDYLAATHCKDEAIG